jgi:uncharacterized membrane protein
MPRTPRGRKAGARARRVRNTTGLLVVILGAAGLTHFARPRIYDGIVPDALPARTTTLVSGAAELAVAAGLVVPRTRRLAGLAAAGLFLAVFPANLKMTRDLLDDPTSDRRMRIGSVLRLPLQIPLLVWAVRVWRGR